MKMFSALLRFRRKAIAALLPAVLLASAGQAQTLYVSVNGGGTIQQVSSTGVVSGFATGLTAPKGVAFDSRGTLYVAENMSGTLQSVISKVSSGGVVSTFATGFQRPLDIAFHPTSGDLYVADSNGIIRKVSGGVVSEFATGLNEPFGLAFNSSGILFVANRNNDTISQMNMSNGTFTTFASGFNDPNDITFDANGNLFVSNFAAGTVSKVTPGGTVSLFASGFSSPVGLEFNPVTGSLFVVNQGTNSISEITPGGSITTFATNISSGPQYLAFTPSAIPEPSTYAAIAGGAMLGLAIWHRRHRHAPAPTVTTRAAA